jgi:acetoin utilization deacetylase AcuC-like enzyme
MPSRRDTVSTAVSLGYVLDEIFVQHRAPSGHPERPARVEAIRDALVGAGIASRGVHVPTRKATDAELAAVHAGSYLTELARVVPGQTGWLDPDTYFSPGTWEAALAAAGSTCELATRVIAGQYAHAIAVVRPPGHHATRAAPAARAAAAAAATLLSRQKPIAWPCVA